MTSDIYYVKQDKAEQDDKEAKADKENKAWINGQVETVIDALVGNLQNEVTSSYEADGSKNISLQLDNAQIPPVVQALAPIAFKHLSDQREGQNHKENATATE